MRIIAGKHKGRRLNTFKHGGTRPTSDKVREALFSKIQNDVKNAAVLDLFAGTGALGLEALSRGANMAYLVDNSKKSYDLIVSNNNLLNEKANILNIDFNNALTGLIAKNKRFNVIFIDPPYASKYAMEAIKIIANNKMLLDNGVIVFEHDKEYLNCDMPEGLRIYDQKRYGSVYLTFITTDE